MTNLLDTIKKVTNKQVSPKPVKSKPVSINERQEVWLNDKRLKWPKKKVIKEAEHDSYKLVIISHDDELSDPNETAPLIRDNAKKLGIEVRFFDPDEPEKINEIVDENTRCVYFESIGNPKNDVPDFKK